MRRAALAIMGLAACAPPAPLPVSAPPPPEAPTIACEPVRDAVDGIAGCLPGHAAYHRTTGDGGDLGAIFSKVHTPTTEASFALFSKPYDDAEAAVRERSMRTWKRVDVSRTVEVDGFHGRAEEGLTDDGDHVALRHVAVGRNLVGAEVHWHEGAPVDRRLVETFLGAFRVQVPWSVHVSVRGKYTVSFPDPGIGKVDEISGDHGILTIASSRWLRGVEERGYLAYVFTLSPTDRRSDDEILDAAATALSAQEGTTLLHSTSAFAAGAEGRAIAVRTREGLFMRHAIFVANRCIYVVTAAAKRLESVDTAESARFFESFQILPP